MIGAPQFEELNLLWACRAEQVYSDAAQVPHTLKYVRLLGVTATPTVDIMKGHFVAWI